jgi:transitional endoplasmic reticulum ATPase
VSVELKVLEAYSRDMGRTVARIDCQTMNLLESTSGDPAEIKGKDGKITFVKVLPLYQTDEGKKIIRIDGLTRKNVGVEVGETVMVKKAGSYMAELVAVTTSEPIPSLEEKYLTNATEGIYVKVGDIVSVPYFGGRLSFTVVGITPSYQGEPMAARITQNTSIG